MEVCVRRARPPRDGTTLLRPRCAEVQALRRRRPKCRGSTCGTVLEPSPLLYNYKIDMRIRSRMTMVSFWAWQNTDRFVHGSRRVGDDPFFRRDHGIRSCCVPQPVCLAGAHELDSCPRFAGKSVLGDCLIRGRGVEKSGVGLAPSPDARRHTRNSGLLGPFQSEIASWRAVSHSAPIQVHCMRGQFGDTAGAGGWTAGVGVVSLGSISAV